MLGIFKIIASISRLLWWLRCHETTCNARDPGSIPGSGKSPGKWNGNPLQYSCLENSMDRGAWWATVQGVRRVGHDWATNTLSISLIVIHLFGFFISSWFSTGRLHVSRDLSISSRLPNLFIVIFYEGFPDSSVGKETSCNAGDPGSIPELGRSPGEGIGYPLKYSGLENSMDCVVHGSQRAGHDWATFTFAFSLLWSSLLLWYQ